MPVASQTPTATRISAARLLPPTEPPPGMKSLMRSWLRRRMSSRSGGPPLPPPCGPEPQGPPDPPRWPHGPPPPLWLLQGILCPVPEKIGDHHRGRGGLSFSSYPPVNWTWLPHFFPSTPCGSGTPLEVEKGKRILIVRPLRAPLAPDLAEGAAVERRENRVPFRV